MPDGNRILSDKELEVLNDWIKQGGTLIAHDNSSSIIASKNGLGSVTKIQNSLDKSIDFDIDLQREWLADKDNIDFIQQKIENNDYETRIKEMADNTLGFGNLREGFGEDEEGDAERDEALKERQDKIEARKKAMKNQKCKYKGKTIFEFLYTCLYYLLYVFIWLAKAVYNMFDSKTKKKPKDFFDALLSPFSWIFWIVKKIFNLIVWFIVKIKDALIYILVMIGNIIFVFVPDFLIDILSYFFAPLIILWRKISGTLFSPFGSFCWDD